MNEQTIDLSELRTLLPKRAKVEFRRKKGQTNRWFLEIEIHIKPPMSHADFDLLKEKILALYGEDLIEIYTEETGHWFFVYLRMSQTVPTTVIP